ncbi:hypothetical protein BN2476_520037 [Paraburkholderia piptadeniae]|uniref:Uncharacterized protein n=1 Tax=Paraburkholderia piptadeniae TaxID=1701573 RepID=A0A1N7SGU8_9BURK|nr:hypothetical protein BN2476_520037 [Paraburkholderia piptadeniae]
MIVGEIVPGVAAFAVILADRPPLPLAEVRPPFLPRHLRVTRVVQAFLFRNVDDYRRHAFPPLRLHEFKLDETHEGASSCAIQATTVYRQRVAPFNTSERMSGNSGSSSKDAVVRSGPFSSTSCLCFQVYGGSRASRGYFHNVGAGTRQGNTVLGWEPGETTNDRCPESAAG